MKCAACRHDNRAGAKFCEECAAPLPRLCAACGVELRPTAKFCDACGAATQGAKASSPTPTPVAPKPSLISASRKVVTILFADLAGSTALQERLDPESARGFMERYYRAMRAAVEAHGGTVVKLLGDGVMAAFGVPTVAEDDAIRAVRAALEMVEVVRLLAVTLLGAEARCGLGTRTTSSGCAPCCPTTSTSTTAAAPAWAGSTARTPTSPPWWRCGN